MVPLRANMGYRFLLPYKGVICCALPSASVTAQLIALRTICSKHDKHFRQGCKSTAATLFSEETYHDFENWDTAI